MSQTNETELPLGVFDRYLAGVASSHERALVARWAGEIPERLQWIRAIALQSQQLVREDASEGTFVADAMLARLNARMVDEGLIRAQSATQQMSPRRVPRVDVSYPRTQGRWTAVATRLVAMRWMVGIVVLVASAGAVVWNQFAERSRTSGPVLSSMREVVTRRGERVSLQLPDGTRAVLGPNSRLRYTPAFDGTQREVILTGLAYFTVVHDVARPFIVRANGTIVRELGTSFSVAASSRDSVVKVIVADGRVAMRAAAAPIESATILARGDMATLGRSSSSNALPEVTHGVDLVAALGWTEGKLGFTAVPLRDVIHELEEWYDVKIVVTDPTLASILVTGEFRENVADLVMLELAIKTGLNYTRHGQYVTLFRSARGSAQQLQQQTQQRPQDQ